jgi:hypothetical protein
MVEVSSLQITQQGVRALDGNAMFQSAARLSLKQGFENTRKLGYRDGSS